MDLEPDEIVMAFKLTFMNLCHVLMTTYLAVDMEIEPLIDAVLTLPGEGVTAKSTETIRFYRQPRDTRAMAAVERACVTLTARGLRRRDRSLAFEVVGGGGREGTGELGDRESLSLMQAPFDVQRHDRPAPATFDRSRRVPLPGGRVPQLLQQQRVVAPGQFCHSPWQNLGTAPCTVERPHSPKVPPREALHLRKFCRRSAARRSITRRSRAVWMRALSSARSAE